MGDSSPGTPKVWVLPTGCRSSWTAPMWVPSQSAVLQNRQLQLGSLLQDYGSSQQAFSSVGFSLHGATGHSRSLLQRGLPMGSLFALLIKLSQKHYHHHWWTTLELAGTSSKGHKESFQQLLTETISVALPYQTLATQTQYNSQHVLAEKQSKLIQAVAFDANEQQHLAVC